MRALRSFTVAILTIGMLTVLLPANAGTSTTSAQTESSLLFVVSVLEGQDASMVPFVILDQGQFKQPVAGDADADELTKFSAAYYAKGHKYRVLFGGGEAGSLTVKKSNKDSECARSSADVTLRTQAKLNRNVMALATNSSSLGGTKSTRRPPTPAERAALMPLVKAAYKQKGLSAALLPGLVTVNLTALDLDNDGKAELVGSFVVKKQTGGAARYALFLIAEPDGTSYRTTVLQYERFTSKDLMSGAEITAIENGVYLDRLVDGLDLDADGASEVIVERDGFEGDTYSIFKKQGGSWKQIYEFSNYRCAF